MSKAATTQWIKIQYNYARQSYTDSQWHIVGNLAVNRGKPRGTAACGVKRIAQQTGDLPMWVECRMVPPENVCHECEIQSCCPSCEGG